MSRLLVLGFTISLDGFGAGTNQSLDNPLGIGGEQLHGWLVNTRTFKQMHGDEGGSTGIDEHFAAQSMTNIGAWIMGRNMFAPSRGEWPDDDSWRGWWGPNPPYHCPVFVLTHYPRPSIEMEGGTVFHFVTEGIHVALERAREAAGGKDIRVGGGVATVRQYLKASLVDQMHMPVSPILLGGGEHLLTGINLKQAGYQCTEVVPGEKAVHYMIGRPG